MSGDDAVARAIAFFAESEDLQLLHRCAEEIAPRVRRMVAGYVQRGGEDSIPRPAAVPPASAAATREEAMATLAGTGDFALLQTLAQAIGRRIEALEIVASAGLPVGARVRVPGRRVGQVEQSGTSLRVRLDGGGAWEGPPSLAERVP